ncbi:o-succinylbenzoate--CoA ligase [Bacillus marinisedimentorum]|uniref:o-succinylbenzoate--CoA ligase n=1 Tax=Bacillus marinisedimentorum TaxID=1821260 RepID=UPI000872AB4E|nr:o-succinylbenzoate--CoA ligase [Bacillus marinisedimentorum]
MHAEMMPNWLEKRAFLSPERTALIKGDDRVSFRELKDRARKYAAAFQSHGIEQGSRCALLIDNSIDSAAAIYGLQSLGAVMVLLNTRLTPAECAWQMKDAEAALLVFSDARSDQAKEASESAGIRAVQLDTLPQPNMPEPDILTEFDLNSLHSIIYTSGTTGKPKGVLLTNGNHWWSAVSSALNLGIQQDDRWLACLPFFHVSGLSILMKSVIYGMSVVIHDQFDPQKVHCSLIQDRVTMISVVSVMLAQVLEELGKDRYPEHLRCVLLGGGPAPKSLLEKSRDKRIPVFQTYGMTETASQIATLSPEYALEKLGSAGKPLFPAELAIFSGSHPAGPGEIGEIAVKGPNVSKGYYKKEADRQAGWFMTGDLGKLDEEGFLYVIDRRSDLIISGGENIYPAEIEDILLSHPAVKEAGVYGIDDEKWGSVPAAAIVLSRDTTEQALQAYCKTRLAGYKVPRKISFTEQLPRNAARKLQRHRLKDLEENGRGYQ